MFIYWIIKIALWALAGMIACKIMKGEPNGLLGNIILGLVGGIVGGFLGNLIGAGDGWIMSILLAIAGSCLVVWVARKLAR